MGAHLSGSASTRGRRNRWPGRLVHASRARREEKEWVGGEIGPQERKRKARGRERGGPVGKRKKEGEWAGLRERDELSPRREEKVFSFGIRFEIIFWIILNLNFGQKL